MKFLITLAVCTLPLFDWSQFHFNMIMEFTNGVC